MRKAKEANAAKNSRVLIGITGGISAYKVPELVRLLKKEGADVTCILTANGARFVTPLTLKTLSKNEVYEGQFDAYDPAIEHISLAQRADIVVVVPATADTLAKLATGRAEDLLSSVVLSTRAPVLLCPAMNEHMWSHPATQNNIRILKKYGYAVVQPEKGELACGEYGVGRLSDLHTILREIKKTLA